MSLAVLSRPEKNPSSTSKSLDAYDHEGRYLYCLVECRKPQDLQCIGVDQNRVYTVPYTDILVVIHACKGEIYRSDDAEIVKRWVLQHQEVVDTFCQRFDAVLPAAFDTIIKGADDKVKEWMRNEYSSIKRKMDKVRGKQEFGVQIFWDSKSLTDRIVKESAEIRKLKDDVQSKPRGTSYMHKQRLKALLKRELESRADQYVKNFYDAIRKQVDDLHFERIPTGDAGREMIMNLSCLASRDKVKGLGATLDRITRTQNFSVRFTGPWPAYSFTT